MKKYVLFAVLVTVVIPVILFSIIYSPEDLSMDNSDHQTDPEMEVQKDDVHHELSICVIKNSGIESMMLEDYIVGVVLGEMPAHFDEEALKAQAIVARTYACKSIVSSKHKQADVCTDSACCQAYIQPDVYVESGGDALFIEKVEQSVSTTKGVVLIYQGELIEATYFSCSGGRTEPAYAVWGTDVPYLQAVDSPGEEEAVHYTDTVVFSSDEFCHKLGNSFSGPSEGWIEEISYTDGGGVAFITLGGHRYTGTEIRKMLNLRSTAFVISAMGDNVIVTTKGYGHRVGMSQYGAQALAQRGKSYETILKHYYPGTELTVYAVDNNSLMG